MDVFSKSMARRLFIQAEIFVSDYSQAMLIVKPNGSWRVVEYDLDTCALNVQLGNRVFHWYNGEWKASDCPDKME